MADEAEQELDLRGYLRVLRRRKWIIALAAMVVTAASLAVSVQQTPVYSGRAEVLLQARTSETLFNTNFQYVDPVRALETEIRVLTSRPVQELVEDRIGASAGVSASPVGDTDVIAITAESTDPERAAVTANAYADAYIDYRRTQSVNDLLDAAAQIQQKIDQLQGQIDALGAGDPAVRPGVSAATDPSTAQRNNLLQQQAVFLQKLDQLQVDAALKDGGAQLVTPAVASDVPIRPTPRRNAILGLVVGLMLGVGIAFLLEFLDDSLRSKEDVERALPGLPVVGLIPALRDWKDAAATVVISVAEPKSPAAEAYRSLRTSVQFMGLDKRIRTIQVTSPSQSEGKSTTIANLAVALAGAGQRVVIVDADLRRPRIERFFDLRNDVGMTSVLLGSVSLPEALQPVPGNPRIHLLASGPIPPNPSELLAGERTATLFRTLSEHADVVLIDCPPILPVTDATVVAPRVDATLLVVRANRTHQGQLRRAVEVMSHVDAPLMGIVLNGLKAEDGYGYSYSYGYRYVAVESSAPRKEAPVPQAARMREPVDQQPPSITNGAGPSIVRTPDEVDPPWRS